MWQFTKVSKGKEEICVLPQKIMGLDHKAKVLILVYLATWALLLLLIYINERCA